MNINQLATKYFDAFSSKDVESLRSMYAEDFYLRDWVAEAQGREEALDLNKQFFDNDFEVNILSTTIQNKFGAETKLTPGTAACEIEIIIKGEPPKSLLVADVIEFSEEGKMKSLRAYLGN